MITVTTRQEKFRETPSQAQTQALNISTREAPGWGAQPLQHLLHLLFPCLCKDVHSHAALPRLIPASPSMTQSRTATSVIRPAACESHGCVFVYLPAEQRTCWELTQPSSSFNCRNLPCSYSFHYGLCDCLWSKFLCWHLCFVGVLVVFILIQYFKWNAEVLIRRNDHSVDSTAVGRNQKRGVKNGNIHSLWQGKWNI